ncbi:hypothetical protein P8864_10475 [Priestia flexa]|uniref:hypothetical protein n=1 Tax=Priestia flexa TaxID=86664 RepID=UPI000C239B20|nr:hypothetical protein [Priestia flexa]MEC0666314.1 hypothetical protein [Priestia flexa]
MKPHEKMEYQLAKEQLEKAIPAMLGAYPTLAKLTRNYYKELIKEGFTEDQALHIVTHQGINGGMPKGE